MFQTHYVVLDGLDLQFDSFWLSDARITDVCHHVWLT